MTQQERINRLAANILELLPESIRVRRDILEDLLVIMGPEHQLYDKVATKLTLIQEMYRFQLELPIAFRALNK